MADWDFLDEVDVLAQRPPNFGELIESKVWKERNEALTTLHELCVKNPRLSTKASYAEIAQQLQTILAKDANINVQAMAAKCMTDLATGLRAKFAPFAPSVVPVVLDKLKEKKPLLRDPLVECLDSLAATVPLESLLEDVVAAMEKPNPQIKAQADAFIGRQMNKLAADKAPKKLIKAVMPCLVKHGGDADTEVRERAFEAIGAIQRLIGDKNVRSMLGDLEKDELKMKKIADAAAKSSEVYEEETRKVAATSKTAGGGGGGGAQDDEEEVPTTAAAAAKPSARAKEADPWDFLEPFDVLAKMPENFQENLDSKKWTERRDALQTLLDLITANPRLDPKPSYGEIVATLKKVLEKDANINVAALAAKTLTGIAQGLRKKFAPHVATVAPVVFEKFKEKKPLLRDPLVALIDALNAASNLEAILDDTTAALENKNPNIKIQTGLFLYRALKDFNPSTAPKKVVKALCPLLVKLTSDSDPEVRDAAFAALGATSKAVGEKPALQLLADILEDNLKMTKIKEFRAKAVEEGGDGEDITAMVQSVHKADAAESAPPKKGPTIKKPLPKEEPDDADDDDEDESLKPPANAVKKEAPKKDAKKEVKKVEEAPPPEEKKKEELLAVNNEKQVRLKEERALKCLKWNFATPDDEHAAQLQTQLGQHAKAGLVALLFHKDFKQQLKAIESIINLGRTAPEALVANSDLLLKWSTLRFFETNPTVLAKVLEMNQEVLRCLLEAGESMSTEELTAFVPYLILKTGEQKENIRTSVREIILQMTDIVSPVKMCPLVIDGLKTKNARQRAECLLIIDTYLQNVGVQSLKHLAVLKAVAPCVGDRDTNVRNAAINAIVTAYTQEGEQVFGLTGKLADKDKSLVDERIKRVGATPGAAPRGGAAASAGGATPARGGPPRSAVRSRPSSRGAAAVSRDTSPTPEALNSTFQMRGRPEEQTSARGSARAVRTVSDLLRDLDRDLPPAPAATAPTSARFQRTNSMSSISSLDSMDQLDKVIQNITSAMPDVAIESTYQVRNLLMSDDQRLLVAERLDAILQAIGVQMSLVRGLHVRDPTNNKSCNELIRTICNFLTSLVQDHPVMILDRATPPSLQKIVMEIIMSLKDRHLESLEGSDQIKRALNVIAVRICTVTDSTSFLVAVTDLVTSSLEDPSRYVYVELLTKCIYKRVESLDRLELHVLLLAVDRFFALHLNSVRGATQESPFYAAKTAMETIIEKSVLTHGQEVLAEAEAIVNIQPRTLEYVRTCTVQLQGLQGGELPGQVPPRAVNGSRPVHFSQQMIAHIANIARGIENMEKNVTTLAEYLHTHPQEQPQLSAALQSHLGFGDAMAEFVREQTTRYLAWKAGKRDRQPIFPSLETVNACQKIYQLPGMSNGGGSPPNGGTPTPRAGIENDPTALKTTFDARQAERKEKPKRRSMKPEELAPLKQRLAAINAGKIE